jgi:integrase
MATTINKLSAALVEKTTKEGRHNDGAGLYLQAKRRNGILRKSWLLLFKQNGARWSQMLGLGGYPETSLSEARQRARDARVQLRSGVNPITERQRLRAEAVIAAQAQKAEAAKRITFLKAAEGYLADNAHDKQWTQSLRDYVYPAIGAMPVALIETVHVADLLRPVWKAKHVTAVRVRGRIERVLDWARVQKLRSGENPAAWRGNLDKIFASKKGLPKVEPHAALPYAELPVLMMKLRSIEGNPARVLEFLTLTATRAGETLGMDWREINLVGKRWSLPGERAKNGKPLDLPLSERAVAILKGQGPKASGLVFPGKRMGGVMSKDLPRKVLHALVGSKVPTLHGMRASFSTWAAERATGIPAETVEVALGHLIGSSVSRAYDRSDRWEQRVKLARMWSDFCATPAMPSTAKVTPLRRKA